jgi:hypothetical protein
MGVFHLRYEGPDKTIEFESPNLITDEGRLFMIRMLYVYDIDATGFMLVDDAGFSAIAATDTYDNINQAGNGWDEFTSYNLFDGNSTNRPGWDTPVITGPEATWGGGANHYVQFTASGDVRGVALIKYTTATKGDHGARTQNVPCIIGITEFTQALSVVNGARLYVSYNLSLTDA